VGSPAPAKSNTTIAIPRTQGEMRTARRGHRR